MPGDRGDRRGHREAGEPGEAEDLREAEDHRDRTEHQEARGGKDCLAGLGARGSPARTACR